jgi:protein-tyrosine kinase
MGRVLDVLRQTQTNGNEEAALSPAPAPVGDDLLSDLGDGDVPFIEVGPARSVEGSAAVLGSQPRLRIAPQPPADAGPILETFPTPATPERVGVSLRPLPGGLALLPPEQRIAAEVIAFHQPQHAATAEYRQLAAALLREPVTGPSRVWLCTGVGLGAGTTSVVLNLGVCLAGFEGLRVVIVDADQSQPTLADALGLRERPGLAEVLAGSESLSQVLQETGIARLTALTAGRAERDRPAFAAAEACRPVLRLLREQFDVILIDGGTDAGGIGAACDAVYLVTPQTQADATATTERVRALLRRGVPLRGCIVTGR